MQHSFPAHLFLVGCGNMAGQMLNRWLACGLDPANVTVLRPSGRPVAPGVPVIGACPDALPAGTTILLGMKPHQLGDAAAGLAPLCTPDMPLVSILAGTPVADLRRHFPAVTDVVRAMPNLPVGLGQGVALLYADALTGPVARDAVTTLFAPLGLAEWIEDEGQLNLLTALSGCGPAYLFRFIDALARAADMLGLPADRAARVAMAMVQGAANMAAGSAETPGQLADRVASPGGTTRQGMNVLDKDDRLLTLLVETLAAARDRGEEMARGE